MKYIGKDTCHRLFKLKIRCINEYLKNKLVCGKWTVFLLEVLLDGCSWIEKIKHYDSFQKSNKYITCIYCIVHRLSNTKIYMYTTILQYTTF